MKNNKIRYVEVSPQMHHFEAWVNTTDIAELKHTMEKLLEESGFTIVKFSEHFFPIQGYTSIWLLAESHLALHTFPESGTSFIQISSCNLEKLHLFKKSDFFD